MSSRGVGALEILGGRSATAPHAPAARDYKAWHGMRRSGGRTFRGRGNRGPRRLRLCFSGGHRAVPASATRNPGARAGRALLFLTAAVWSQDRVHRRTLTENEIIKTSCCPCTRFGRSGSRQRPFWAWVLYFQRPPWHHLTVPCFISGTIRSSYDLDSKVCLCIDSSE